MTGDPTRLDQLLAPWQAAAADRELRRDLVLATAERRARRAHRSRRRRAIHPAPVIARRPGVR